MAVDETERQFYFQIIEKLLSVNHELTIAIAGQKSGEPTERQQQFDQLMQTMMLKMVGNQFERGTPKEE